MTQQTIKIPYDSLTLRAVVAELRDRLQDGHLQEIRQPDYTDIYLMIRASGQNQILCLSNDARFARVHLTQSKPANTPTPLAFCQNLRKNLIGGRINDVRQIGFDRILEIEINALDENGDKTTLRLIAEMMGKHSNLVLVNRDGLILDAARRISHKVNRFRETQPGLPYVAPPIQENRTDPFAHNALQALDDSVYTRTQRELEKALAATFDGMSPFLTQELSARAFRSDHIKVNLHAAWIEIFTNAKHHEYAPVAVTYHTEIHGAYPFPLLTVPAAQQKPAANLNLALDAAFKNTRAQADFDAQAGDLRARLERALRRVEKQRESLERAQEESANAEVFKQTGELILANVWQIPPNADRVTVQDYFDPTLPNRTLELDPTLTAQENAEAAFKRYRRAKSGENPVQEQSDALEIIEKSLRDAQAQLVRWETSGLQTGSDVRAWRDELMQTGILKADDGEGDNPLPDFEGNRIKRYLTPEGYTIYLGENATSNDYLTRRIAAPNDLWLHVRADTSAHVVIVTRGKPDLVPRSVLMRAASLCALNSSQKHAALVSVDYTLKKYVRKPRGAAPGSVNYEREKTLDIAPKE